MPRIPSAASAALLASLLLAGCSTPTDTTPPPAANSKEPSPEAPQQDGTVAFGESYAYEDGVTLTVSAPEPFEPSEFASGTDLAHQVIFTYTVTNGSNETLDAGAYITASSGGVEAIPIYDTEQEVSFDPSTSILPEQSITWRRAWSVADLDNIVMQVTPLSFVYSDIIFTNSN